MNAQDKRAHNAEALQELKAIANALPALATKVDVIVRLERAERMAATINRIIQTHAADAAHTRIPDLTDDEWMILFHERPDLKDRLNAIFDKAAYLSRYRSQCKTSTEAAQARAQSGEWVMVPREPTEWMLQAAEDAVNAAAHCESTTDDLSAIAYKAALAAAPQQAAEPVYQMRNGNAWFDIPRKQFARIDSVSTRVLYTTPQAGEPVGHARTDGCMHFAYLPWSVKDGDPVYAAPPAERVQEKAEPVAWMHPELHKGHPYPEECLSTEAFDGWLPLYTHPQPPAQSGASKFVHSSPESRQAVLERVAERATQAQLEQSAQCAKDAARGIDAPADGP